MTNKVLITAVGTIKYYLELDSVPVYGCLKYAIQPCLIGNSSFLAVWMKDE